MLFKHGIASNLKEAEYEILVSIYQKKPHRLTAEDIHTYKQILSKIKWNNAAKVLLIGDDLADRGQNDYFVLKIFEKLEERKVPVEVLLSNHAIEFVEATENKDNFGPSMLTMCKHDLSMQNLQMLIEKNLVSREEVMRIVRTAYKPNLRILSYTLSEDDSSITLFSHAPIDLKIIKKLAEQLNISYKDESAKDLANTIDNINDVVQAHIKNNTLHQLYSREAMQEGYIYADCNLEDFPFEFILWNRNYDVLHREKMPKGVKVNYVHGHDSNENTHDNIYNLNNVLGKNLALNEGQYTVYLSTSGEVPRSETTIPEDSVDADAVNTILNRKQWLDNFSILLNKIYFDSLTLQSEGKIDEARAARSFFQNICNHIQDFIDGRIDSSEEFIKKCHHAVEIARPNLQQLPLWKTIIGALWTGIIFLPYWLKGADYRKNSVFIMLHTPESARDDLLLQKLNEIDTSIGELKK